MKIKVILFVAVAIFFSCNFSYGQVSSVDYQKAVNYLNCKTVELSLKKSPTEGTAASFQKKIPDCKNVLDFNTIKNAIDSREKDTVDLSFEIDKIKNNPIEPQSKEEVIQYLSDSVFKDPNYPILNNFATNHSDSVDNLKDLLRNAFSAQIQASSNGNSNNNNNTNGSVRITLGTNGNTVGNTSANTVTNTTTTTTGSEPDWFYWFVSLITLLLLVLMLYFFYSKHTKIVSTLNFLDQRLKSVEGKVNTIPPKTGTQTSGNSSSDEVEKRLKTAFSLLESKVNLLEEQIRDAEKPPQVTIPKLSDWNRETEAKNEIFYFPSPNDGRTFNANSAQLIYKEGASIYKFTKTSQKSANFQIDERESSMQQALRYPETNIEPVCDAENSRNDSEKRIVTTQLGEARLDGDKWIVNRKAKIRYEH